MKIINPPNATPLNLDEIQGLIPIHISTQSELNEWEQANILEAETWAFFETRHEILNISFVLELHRKMFSKTWRWAGQLRKSNKNIGIDWQLVAVNLKQLFDDIKYQIDNRVYNFDEIAARFHHRLVVIHPFSNGNGRHARLMTDILLIKYQQPKFTWGFKSKNIKSDVDIRKDYIKALQAADRYNYSALFDFIRS